MGNILGKANIFLKLKNPKESYKPGEPVDIIIEFQSNKVFKDAEIKVAFEGIKDNKKLFEVKKILSVGRWNNKESINQLHEIKFDIASPVDVANDVSINECDLNETKDCL
jgi:hypothetical protein